MKAMLATGNRDTVARHMAQIAAEAGDVLNAHRAAGCESRLKPDGSPVSEADLAAEACLSARLAETFPQVPVVSEENAASHGLAPHDAFFLVDPLDGTKAFLSGGADFCVLVALIQQGRPVAGAIHAPATGMSWWAGEGAFLAEDRAFTIEHPVRLCPRRQADKVAVVSALHAAEASTRLCEKLKVGAVRNENSALKFARLATGDADLYPRIGRTMQWDIAAGDALLRALGGGVFDMSGRPMVYGAQAQRGWANPDFIALRCAEDLTDCVAGQP